MRNNFHGNLKKYQYIYPSIYEVGKTFFFFFNSLFNIHSNKYIHPIYKHVNLYEREKIKRTLHEWLTIDWTNQLAPTHIISREHFYLELSLYDYGSLLFINKNFLQVYINICVVAVASNLRTVKVKTNCNDGHLSEFYIYITRPINIAILFFIRDTRIFVIIRKPRSCVHL